MRVLFVHFLSTLIIICSMVITRPKGLKVKFSAVYRLPFYDVIPGFVVHPSTSELAERLQVDSEFLSKENYSGIYDENGDFIPQYCDDPEKIPQSTLVANQDKTPPSQDASPGGTPGPDDTPAEA